MKNLLLISSLAAISLLIACGSNSNSSTPGGTSGGNSSGPFSNASLKGQYAYLITGTNIANNDPFSEAGYFVADGNGNITSCEYDFSETTGVGVQSSSTSGTYSVAGGGTGTLALNVAGGNWTFSLTVVSKTEVLMTESDSFGVAAGRADFQNASSLTGIPMGTFVFRLHTFSRANQSASLVGAMTVSSGAITGSDDVLRGSLFDNSTGSSLTISGTLGAPSNGRGTGSITDASGTVNFLYYVVDSNHLNLLDSDGGVVGIGTAEIQSGTPYANNSFNNSYAFGSRADDRTGLNAQNTVGVFTSDGNGNIVTGAYDSVQDGVSVAQGTGLSGTYAASSNGRVTVTLTPSGNSVKNIELVLWLVSPGQAYSLTDDTTKVEDGTFDQQQSGAFFASNLKGEYVFAIQGVELTTGPQGLTYLTRSGFINSDGAGSLTWNGTLNNSISGFSTPGKLSGNYSVALNGRGVATVNHVSVNANDIVFYLVSGTKAYMLQNDSSFEVAGSMTQQPQP